jgi:hypothetical protein
MGEWMRMQQRKALPIAIVLGAVALPAAHAGFIDERPAASVPAHASPAPKAAPSAAQPKAAGQAAPLVGEVRGATAPGWAGRAPAMRGQSMSLLDALVDLMPADQPGLRLAVVATDTSAQVHWAPHTTRLQALQQVLREQGLSASIMGHEFHVAPAAVPGAVTVGASGPVPKLPTPPKPTFTLVAGQSLEHQLQDWAKWAGWTVVWNEPHDWLVPGAATFGTNFQQAVEQVVMALAKNGADVRADVYPPNRTIVIHPAGASEGGGA